MLVGVPKQQRGVADLQCLDTYASLRICITLNQQHGHPTCLDLKDLKPETNAVPGFMRPCCGGTAWRMSCAPWRGCRCKVKVIDLGSSCFTSDVLGSYVQSRAYRAPEVVVGLPYGQAVDLWSLGAILAELLSARVLFQVPSTRPLPAHTQGPTHPRPAPLDAGVSHMAHITHCAYFT